MTSTTPYKPVKHPTRYGYGFRDYSDNEDVRLSQARFLFDVWHVHDIDRPIFTFLGFKSARTGKWVEHVVGDWSPGAIGELLSQYPRDQYDQYFCPNLFFKPHRKAAFAYPSQFAWCDMDASDPEDYDPWASLVWETSPGRYQGIWAWDRTHSPAEAEAYSRALAYRHGGDRNGWSITKMLRVIGTINHKPEYDEPVSRTVHCDWTRISARPVPMPSRKGTVAGLRAMSVDPTAFERRDVLRRYRQDLHPKVRYLIGNQKVRERDRSACIFHMIAGLHEAGASEDEIASVLWSSPYFVEKHGQHVDKLNQEIARVIGKLEHGA